MRETRNDARPRVARSTRKSCSLPLASAGAHEMPPAPLFAALVALALALPAAARLPGGYNISSRRVRGVLNLHLVPHTHDDVGWLKTVDQYFYGGNNSIQRAGVQNILNAVMKELAWNDARKFSYVEQAFFQRWWDEADDKMRALTQGLVASGQLQFVNGGWCMHDEANPGFVDMIDQTTLGHRLLLEQFGVRPTTTWQIDRGCRTLSALRLAAL